MVSFSVLNTQTHDVLKQFMTEIHEDEVKLSGLDSRFLSDRRELAKKSGVVARQCFNLLARHVNRQAGKICVPRIVHPAVLALRESIGIQTVDVQNLVLSALGTGEFERSDMDQAIELAREVNAYHIDLFGKITDAQLRRIAEIRSLRSIHFHSASFPESSLIHLAQHEKLHSISITRCDSMTDKALLLLGKIQSLEHLDLSYCYHITGVGLRHIRQLRRLNLSCCYNLTDDGITALSGLENLRCLNLSRNTHSIRDKHLVQIAKLKNLTSLDLSNCWKLCKLEPLAALKSLTFLNLSKNMSIRFEEFRYLARLIELEWLGLSRCEHLTDQNLKYLESLNRLKSLDLSECCNVTDKGIEHLTGLNLKHLDIGGCRNLTAKKIAALKRVKAIDLPDLVEV